MATKILLLNNRVPFPLKDGGARATHTLIESLSKQGAEVSLFFLNTRKHYMSADLVVKEFSFAKHITIEEIDTTVTKKGALKSAFAGTSYNIDRFYKSDIAYDLGLFLRDSEFDIIHFETLFMAPYLEVVRKNCRAKCVLRMHNVEFQIWKKLAIHERFFLKKHYLHYLSNKLAKYEKMMVPKFDAVLPISRTDEQWAKQFTTKPIHYLPAGFYFEKETVKAQNGNNFFHIGSMEWKPNVQACQYLVKEIWPMVISKNPELQLHLAGKGMNEYFKSWATENIHIHGEVDDAAAFMKQYQTMLIPLQSASGVRMKAIEAMQYGKPVISTTIGMSGLDAKSNENCLIADDTNQFVNAILTLPEDNGLYQKLSANGMAYVQNYFEADAIAKNLIQFYNQILKPRNNATSQY